jgi:Na+/H+ antiporter NhaD/arsenite permease-like protein
MIAGMNGPFNIRRSFEALWLYAPTKAITPSGANSNVRVVLLTLLLCASYLLVHWVLGNLQNGSSPAFVPLRWCFPFVLLLLTIAVLPVVVPHIWRRFYIPICSGIGLLAALDYSIRLGGLAEEAKSFALYLQFIIMLTSLFVIASGILISVKRPASPAANVAILFIGAILTNLLGTTGASILLIRPFLRMNQPHIRPFHVVLFVFIVANVGGVLLPLGNPPLLAGYLMGMPFWWMLLHAWAPWLLAVTLLLFVFYLLDRRIPRSASDAAEVSGSSRVSLQGLAQLLFIAIVLAGLFLPSPWSEIMMLSAAGISFACTPAAVRQQNRFTFHPLREMAILFLAIFLTLAPVLNILSHAAAAGKLESALQTPSRCYFITGGLSAFLDNAPSYLACLQSRASQVELQYHAVDTIQPATVNAHPAIEQLAADPAESLYILAISLSAVFFGAATWIGNGPNLMIKSISEHEGVACPSFGAYILRYTIPILVPVLVLVWLVFLR